MLRAVNPDLHISCPKETARWARNNWNKITPGNATLLLECNDYNNAYSWGADIPASEAILQFAVEQGKDSRCTALSCEFTRQEVLNRFIEGELTIQLERIASLPSSAYRDRNDHTNAYAQALINNKKLKIYQIQMLWSLGEKYKSFGKDLCNLIRGSSMKLDTLPDYIFEGLFKATLKFSEDANDYYYGSDRVVKVFEEAMRRGYIVRSKPPVTVVREEMRPILKELPPIAGDQLVKPVVAPAVTPAVVAVQAPVMPFRPIMVLRPMVPGKVYR